MRARPTWPSAPHKLGSNPLNQRIRHSKKTRRDFVALAALSGVPPKSWRVIRPQCGGAWIAKNSSKQMIVGFRSNFPSNDDMGFGVPRRKEGVRCFSL